MLATRVTLAVAAVALLAGCATTPGSDEVAGRDPLEGFNRGVWGINQGVDRYALKPASTAYRTVTPRPARRGLTRVMANLGEPFSAINNLLQGKPGRALRNLERFVINTTIGVGGLADHATTLGLEPAYEDFGQTLARWGVDGGPYLVLPLLGPSTLRDGAGTAVGFVADPYNIALPETGLNQSERIGLAVLNVVNIRANLTESGADAFLASSLDPYTAARSAFLQRRRLQILNEDGVVVTPPAAGSTAVSPSDDAALDAAVREAQDAAGDVAPAPGVAPSTAPQPAIPDATPPASDPALDEAVRELEAEEAQGSTPAPGPPAAPPRP